MEVNFGTGIGNNPKNIEQVWNRKIKNSVLWLRSNTVKQEIKYYASAWDKKKVLYPEIRKIIL